jgi:hypothetical protein
MRVCEEVSRLVSLNPPPSEAAVETEITQRQELIESFTPPVSLPEAILLANILGPDSCLGLAWSLVQLIDSAPGWSEEHVPPDSAPFLSSLRIRLHNRNNTIPGASSCAGVKLIIQADAALRRRLIQASAGRKCPSPLHQG